MINFEECKESHPEHVIWRCYRRKGHGGAHHSADNWGTHTWGIKELQVVAELLHNGSRYLMLDDGYFEGGFLQDRAGSSTGKVDWRYELTGLHVGRPLDVWLINVRLEYDDDGPRSSAAWDRIVWADTGEVLEDAAFLDGYTDVLVPIVKEDLCQ